MLMEAVRLIGAATDMPICSVINRVRNVRNPIMDIRINRNDRSFKLNSRFSFEME